MPRRFSGMTKLALLFVLLSSLPLLAQAREYPYPSEPQYQYPEQTKSKKAMKCPRGQAPFQGKCRIVRTVY